MNHEHTNRDELVERMRALYESELTLTEVGDQLGVSAETVRRLLKQNGIPRRPRGQPEGKYRPAGGRVVDKNGYVLVRARRHPAANASGYVREHRLVMEHVLGRYLEAQEVVHHINGIKSDNRPENLQLYASNAAHKAEDMLGNSYSKGDVGNPRRSVRVRRSTPDMVALLVQLALSQDGPIRRSQLAPPFPSYRAVAARFGSWQAGVALAKEAADRLRSALTSDGSSPELREPEPDVAA